MSSVMSSGSGGIGWPETGLMVSFIDALAVVANTKQSKEQKRMDIFFMVIVV